MAIFDHYNETVSTLRLDDILDEYDMLTGRKDYNTYLTGVDCEIQPVDDAIAQTMAVTFGKTWLMFCQHADIKEGDLVEREDGVKYRVVGVKDYDWFRGYRGHMEVRIAAFRS